ncbi:MAG: cyclase family protein [Thermoplasmatales archaeon]
MVLFGSTNYEVIDLSHTLYHRMPGWPGHPQFTVTDLKILCVDGYAVKNLSMNTHHGTHIDVEAHMVENGLTLEKYPLEDLMGRGIVIDVSGSRPASPIDSTNIEKCEEYIREKDIVLLHTGWDKFRGNNQRYLFEWPFVDQDLATFFVRKKIKMLGTDGLSVGGWGGNTETHKSVTNTSLEVHQLLLRNKIILLEELANLDKILNGKECEEIIFMALPLAIDGADGSPVRAIAFTHSTHV